MEPPLEDMTRRRVTVCIRGEWEGPKGLVAHARLVQVAENVWGHLCTVGIGQLVSLSVYRWSLSPFTGPGPGDPPLALWAALLNPTPLP